MQSNLKNLGVLISLNIYSHFTDRIWNYEQGQKAKSIQAKYEEMATKAGVKHYSYKNLISPDPRGAICEACEKTKPTLLVMGSRGLGKSCVK
jgi:nucleotide-binding universal stress UspA family protein